MMVVTGLYRRCDNLLPKLKPRSKPDCHCPDADQEDSMLTAPIDRNRLTMVYHRSSLMIDDILIDGVRLLSRYPVMSCRSD